MYLTKGKLTKMINEAAVNEATMRQRDYIDQFKLMLRKIASKDKELNMFCEQSGVSKDSDEYLILASYLYSTLKSVGSRTELGVMKSLKDNVVRTCCENLEDLIKHGKEFDVALQMMNKMALGNKFVACNIWKVLTNKNYNPKDERPPRLNNFNPDDFTGEMLVNGRTVRNTCKYTMWSLLWLLANGGSGQLNEAKRNKGKGKKNKGTRNRNNTAALNEINNLINLFKIRNGDVKNRVKNYIYNVYKNFNYLYNDFCEMAKDYASYISKCPENDKLNTIANIFGAVKTNYETPKYIDYPQEDATDEEPETENQNQEQISDTPSDAETGDTGTTLNLISEDEVQDVIVRMNNLIEMTNEYEEKLEEAEEMRNNMAISGKLNEDETNNGTEQPNKNNNVNNWFTVKAEEIVNYWKESSTMYAKYFGQSVSLFFIYPEKIARKITNANVDLNDVDAEGKKWDSEEITTPDDLKDAIEAMKQQYGIGVKWYQNKNTLDLITKIGSGIGRALGSK